MVVQRILVILVYILEIENSFRIIAKFNQIPTIGKSVSISKCGIKDGDYFLKLIKFCKISNFN